MLAVVLTEEEIAVVSGGVDAANTDQCMRYDWTGCGDDFRADRVRDQD